jgi:hypothetical protein
MRSNNFFILLLVLTMIAGCGGGGSSSGGSAQPKTLVSIAITPANVGITAGATQQFSATGTFSDNSAQDLTATATWSSSSPAVATISATGLATSGAAGATVITALSAGVVGTASLTVAPSTTPIIPITPVTPVTPVTGDSSTVPVTGSANNVMPVTVNGSLCSSGSYFNKPCTSVTVCTPGTSTCQVVTDLLLDTGSYGLRIFKQALGSVTLPQVSNGSGALAECVQFGDGSSDWGPVRMADVILGNEPAVQVPIQVIDSTFGTRSRACLNADTSPSVAGFNGILGVGLFAQDCGTLCTTSLNNGLYSACNGSVCASTTVALSSQVQNPVALLPVDNNGVLVQLPGVASGGAPAVNGSLILGIGTQANNTPTSVVAYSANTVGEFTTTFNGMPFITSIIDSGSNGLYFPAPATLLPGCLPPNTGFYCPAATASLSAVTTGAFGTPSATISFQIANFTALSGSANNVFNNIGGVSGLGFDWGLPFFLGRNVYVGIEGRSSGLGSGPYWAY